MWSAECEVRNRNWGRRLQIIFFVVAGIFLAAPAAGAEDPDELYRQGRYAEAEKIYARSDMDNPKDVRHRYNRGCANYQNNDYKGAVAAFSSVLTRAKDKGTRLKAAYNLGNAAFKQGDVAAAAAYYRKAILIDPESENARYNLELALRELEKLKKEKQEGQKGSGPEGNREDMSKDNKKEKGEGKGSQDKDPNDKESEKEPGGEKRGDGEKAAAQGEARRGEQESPKDLSGELRPNEALPEQKETAEGSGEAISLMDKEKAEALLDNVKEDRSKFLELQTPEGKRRGVLSGKDW